MIKRRYRFKSQWKFNTGWGLLNFRCLKIYLINHLPPIRMAITEKKKIGNNKCSQEWGEIGMLVHSRWEYKIVQTLWKTIWPFLKTVIDYHMIGQSHLWIYISKMLELIGKFRSVRIQNQHIKISCVSIHEQWISKIEIKTKANL